MAWEADIEARREQVAMKAVRAAIDRIKETGASEEDAVRLITARAENPAAFNQFFSAPAPSAPPESYDSNQYFMGAPVSQMPGAPGYDSSVPPAPPRTEIPDARPADEEVPGGYQPPNLFRNARSTMDTEDAFIGQGIADMRWDELGMQRPTSTSPLPLGQAGQETLSRNFVVPPEPGQTAYYDAPIISADKSAFGHELSHTYQAERFPNLDQFVAKVQELAAAGDETAKLALLGYGQPNPMNPKAYQGASDPQHLYTQFIDLAQVGVEIPKELAPYYKGLFEGNVAQLVEQKRMEPIRTKSFELVNQVQTEIIAAGSLRGAIEKPQPVSALMRVIRAVTNNVAGQALRMSDPETAELIRSLGVDDLEPEEILDKLVKAGFKIAVVDG